MHLLDIGLLDLVEGHGAVAGIVDVRRDRQRAVGRADRTRHESAPAVLLLGELGRLAGETCALRVQLVDDRFHAVIGLSDHGAGKRVGLADVGASEEIVEVDLPDSVGLGQDQEVVVALLVVGVIGEAPPTEIRLAVFEPLDDGAHGAVKDEDLFSRAFAQNLLDLGAVNGAQVGHLVSFRIVDPISRLLARCCSQAQVRVSHPPRHSGARRRREPGIHDWPLRLRWAWPRITGGFGFRYAAPE